MKLWSSHIIRNAKVCQFQINKRPHIGKISTRCGFILTPQTIAECCVRHVCSTYFNPLVTTRYGGISKAEFSNYLGRIITWAFTVIWLSGKCPGSTLVGILGAWQCWHSSISLYCQNEVLSQKAPYIFSQVVVLICFCCNKRESNWMVDLTLYTLPFLCACLFTSETQIKVWNSPIMALMMKNQFAEILYLQNDIMESARIQISLWLVLIKNTPWRVHMYEYRHLGQRLWAKDGRNTEENIFACLL